MFPVSLYKNSKAPVPLPVPITSNKKFLVPPSCPLAAIVSREPETILLGLIHPSSVMDCPFAKSKLLSFAISIKSSLPSNFNFEGSPILLVPSQPDGEPMVGNVKLFSVPSSKGDTKSDHILVLVVLFAEVPKLSMFAASR